MTDHSALIERLVAYRPTNEWGDKVHHDICAEAAAALRDLTARNEAMSVRLDRAMTIIGAHHAARMGKPFRDLFCEIREAGE